MLTLRSYDVLRSNIACTEVVTVSKHFTLRGARGSARMRNATLNRRWRALGQEPTWETLRFHFVADHATGEKIE